LEKERDKSMLGSAIQRE